MSRLTAILMMTMLLGCAAQSGPEADQAVVDFVVVSELEEADSVRTRKQFNYEYLTERYVILDTGRDKYLVEFVRRCRELNEIDVTPDIRYDARKIHARLDTIRGCRIARLFQLDEAQAQELRDLGDTPGTSFN